MEHSIKMQCLNSSFHPHAFPQMRPLSSSLKNLYGMVPLNDPMHKLKINRFNHQQNNKGNSNVVGQTTSKTSHHISYRYVQAGLHCNDTPCYNLELYTLNLVMNTCHQNNEVPPRAPKRKLHVELSTTRFSNYNQIFKS